MGSRFACLLSFVTLACVPVHAAVIQAAPPEGLLAHEPFDYTPAATPIVGKTGGLGFASAWVAGIPGTPAGNSITAGTSNLVYAGLASTGVRMRLSASGGQAMQRTLMSPLGADDTIRYVSLLVRPDTTPTATTWFGLLLMGGNGTNLFVGKPGGGQTMRYVLEDGGGARQFPSAQAVVNGTTVLLVVKVEFRAGADRISLFINPPLNAEPAVANAVKQDLDLGVIRSVALNNSMLWSADELRIGTSFTSVLPAGPDFQLRTPSSGGADELVLVTRQIETVAPLPTGRTLTFELVGETYGATIHPTTGAFAWTPGELDGGLRRTFTVRATSNATPPVVATASFNLDVREVNEFPQVDPTPDQSVIESAIWSYQVIAVDRDIPAQTLSYAVRSGPPGMTASATGLITWPTTGEHAGRSFLVVLNVFDSAFGLTERRFNVTVQARAALTARWIGTADGDWNNSANWDIGRVPNNTALEVFTVSAAAHPVTIRVSGNFTVSHLNLGGGETIALASASDSLTVEKDFDWTDGTLAGAGQLIALDQANLAGLRPDALTLRGECRLVLKREGEIATPLECDGSVRLIVEPAALLEVLAEGGLVRISGVPELRNEGSVMVRGSTRAIPFISVRNFGTFVTFASTLDFQTGAETDFVQENGGQLNLGAGFGAGATLNGTVLIADGSSLTGEARIQEARVEGNMQGRLDFGRLFLGPNATSTFDLELARDRIVVADVLALAGRLVLMAPLTLRPGSSEAFELMQAAKGITGEFTGAPFNQRIEAPGGIGSFLLVRSEDFRSVLLRDFQRPPAVPGNVDRDFLVQTTSPSGGEVHKIVVQPDGSILVGGHFNYVGGQPRSGIARLEADGTVMPLTEFNPALLFQQAVVYAIVPLSDGSILIGGEFASVGNEPRNKIARLTNKGVLDTTFNPAAGVSGGTVGVRGMALQPDDQKILIVGGFAKVNDAPRNGIARLTDKGALDAGFNPGIGPNGLVMAVAVQANGKILIGGSFPTFNNQFRPFLVRLDTNGSLEESFNPGLDSAVRALLVLPGGKILVGGDFEKVGGETRPCIVRLNEDGTVDMSFNPVEAIKTSDGFTGNVNSLALQPDGKIVVGGIFATVNGTPQSGIARLAANGAVESVLDFIPGTGATRPFGDASVNSVAVQADGKILAGGDFEGFSGVSRRALVRLATSGRIENPATFEPGVIATYISNGPVNATAVQPDGKIIIGGQFGHVNGAPRGNIARIHPDGTVEDTETFNAGSGAGSDSPVWAIAVQADGHILLSGQFEKIDGLDRPFLARLYPNGNVESSETFHPRINPLANIYCLALQPPQGNEIGESILIGGQFAMVEDKPHPGIARLKPDGSLDSTFNAGVVGRVYSMVVQSDGGILIGGDFSQVNGEPRDNLARLDRNGVLDAGFKPAFVAEQFGKDIQCIALQPDGTDWKILIGGRFAGVNTESRVRIARLHASGEVDTGFDAGAGPDAFVSSLTLQVDGKIVVGGAFRNFNNQPRKQVARLLRGGALDDAFDIGPGAKDGQIEGVALQVNGGVLVNGDFNGVAGQPNIGLARLLNEPGTQSLTVSSGARLQWLRSGAAPEVEQVTFELSADGGATWRLLGTGARIEGGWERSGLNLPASGSVRARGRTFGSRYNGSSGLVESVLVFGQVGPLRPRLSPPQVTPGQVSFRFTGVPGQVYQIQRVTSITAPWATIAQPVVGPEGFVDYTDTQPPPGAAFYRTGSP